MCCKSLNKKVKKKICRIPELLRSNTQVSQLSAIEAVAAFCKADGGFYFVYGIISYVIDQCKCPPAYYQSIQKVTIWSKYYELLY